MTYNFDVERWYAIEYAFHRAQYAAGRLTEAQFEQAVDELQHRYDAMCARLDGTYRIDPQESG